MLVEHGREGKNSEFCCANRTLGVDAFCTFPEGLASVSMVCLMLSLMCGSLGNNRTNSKRSTAVGRL